MRIRPDIHKKLHEIRQDRVTRMDTVINRLNSLVSEMEDIREEMRRAVQDSEEEGAKALEDNKQVDRPDSGVVGK